MTDRAPLVPVECDLRGMPWMPIETVRLLDSDIFALATGDEFKAAVALWCKAWQQVPAASLPDDDRILARLSGAGTRWKKVRDQALRGFVLCTDGRLYHPVIAEKALEAWAHRQKQRDRAAKRWHSPGNAAAHATASATAMQGTGTVKGQGPKETKPSAAARRPRGEGEVVPVTSGVWNAYAAAYQDRYGVEPTRNAKVNGQLASFLNRVPAGEAPEIAAFYVGHDKGLYVSSKHCVDLLLRDAEGLRTEWLTGRKVTDTQARQADRTAATGSLVDDLLAEKRRAA